MQKVEFYWNWAKTTLLANLRSKIIRILFKIMLQKLPKYEFLTFSKELKLHFCQILKQKVLLKFGLLKLLKLQFLNNFDFYIFWPKLISRKNLVAWKFKSICTFTTHFSLSEINWSNLHVNSQNMWLSGVRSQNIGHLSKMWRPIHEIFWQSKLQYGRLLPWCWFHEIYITLDQLWTWK